MTESIDKFVSEQVDSLSFYSKVKNTIKFMYFAGPLGYVFHRANFNLYWAVMSRIMQDVPSSDLGGR